MNPSSSVLIINADDFGLSVPVNKAIDHCFKYQLINSTSMMVNTPEFEQACTLANASMYKEYIGLHVNLTQGRPVSEFHIRKYLDREGNWDSDKIKTFRIIESTAVKKAFKIEILEQLKRFENAGFKPSHINSHHHTHTLPWLFPIFLEISAEMKYPLRIAQTSFSGSKIKAGYRKIINSILKKRNLNFSDYFETMDSYEKRQTQIAGNTIEIMVHPTYNKEGLLIDALDNLEFNHNYLFKK
jgi:chitin disaccharide deacetylase